MKRRIALAVLSIIALSALFAGCSAGKKALPDFSKSGSELFGYPAYTEKDGTWAIYIYICGSDLESHDPDKVPPDTTFGLASMDIAEITGVKMPKNVNIVMQMGGAKNWANNLDPTMLNRVLHNSDGTVDLPAAPLASMGDPNTLAEFLAFCNTYYPAQNQVVILWDHGGGSLFGFASDEVFGKDSMSLPEVSKAFEAAPAASGSYEIIGFDACLMATVDVVAAVKDYGNYLVASEEVEPGVGWYYTGALENLVSGTSQTPESFAKSICDSYYQELLDLYTYNKRNFYQTATLSVIDLKKSDMLTKAYEAMANEALIFAIDRKEEYLSQFARAAKASENYGYNTAQDGFFEMVDLGDLVANASELLPESKPLVEAAIQECVVHQVNGPLRSKATGVSSYYCYSGKPKSVEFYEASGSSKAMAYYHEYSVNGILSEAGMDYVAEITAQAQANISILAPTEGLGLDGTPVFLDADGYWSIDISPENAQSIACVYNYMLWDSGGGMQVLFGYSDEIAPNWESGVFSERYTGLWGCIDDAQLFLQPIATGDGYTVYSSPVVLNGVLHSLFVSKGIGETGSAEYTILGVSRAPDDSEKSMDNGEMASKEMLQLSEGDVLEPLHYFLLKQDDGSIKPDAFSVMSINIGEDPQFFEKSLGDGHFQIRFCMVDYAGNEYSSQQGDFKVKNGVIERAENWQVFEKPANAIAAVYVQLSEEQINQNAQSPYYIVVLESLEDTAAARLALGLPSTELHDQMSGDFTTQLVSNNPQIDLGDYVGERLVYINGTYIDGRAGYQREVVLMVDGIMAGEGGTNSLSAGTLKKQ
ncbi:MAG: clostripain-related cysteine peptidase [Eubacteriaceae bacterium]|nr:clostripain-related cysteine peptidase [Eubacteriaceae bacterium]